MRLKFLVSNFPRITLQALVNYNPVRMRPDYLRTPSALIAVLCLSVLLASCGRGKPKNVEKSKNGNEKAKSASRLCSAPSKKSKNASNKKKLVDSDSFSKAFSKTVYKNNTKVDSEKKSEPEIDWRRFYHKGGLATTAFTPGEYAGLKVPSSSLAAAVTDGQSYSWLPHWRYSGKGGVVLPGCALSPDASFMAILETVFPKNASPSTLLILINTYNWKIVSILHYRGRVFSSLRFRPKSSVPEVVVWEKGSESGAMGHLRLISLRNGSVLSSSDDVAAENVSYAIAPSGAFLALKTDAGTNSLYILSFSNLSGKPKKITTKQSFGIPAVSTDSSTVAFAGEERVELFSADDCSSIDTIKHSIGVPPDVLAFVGNGNDFALSGYDRPCLLIIAGQSKKLCERSGRHLFMLHKTSKLVFEEYKNSMVSVFDLKTLSKRLSFNPQRVKPKTRGEVVFMGYLPHLKRFVELDSKGNLFLFYQPGRKWRKKNIFSAER